MNTDTIRVLYIAGSGRTGSTILQNILGQIDGFLSVGELHYVWERGFIKNKLCGCGAPFLECDLWRGVVQEAFGGPGGVNAEEMFRLNRSFRIKHLALSRIPGVAHQHLSRLGLYLDNLEKLYAAIKTMTGSPVIVDSSKTPVFGYLLGKVPSISLTVVHFLRDSRATAYAWSKKKLFEPNTANPEYMARRHPVKSSLQWDARNLLTEVYLRNPPSQYMVLRYEDFIAQPRESVRRIAGLVGEVNADLPFLSEHAVEITKANHSVFGNIVRFQRGRVELKVDEEWKKKMPKSQQMAAVVLTWPLLVKYGYV